MDRTTTAQKVADGLNQLMQHIPAKLPSMGWYFADTPPTNAIRPDKGLRTCMFSHMASILRGRPLCFSPEQCGCGGASCYLGFTQPSAHAGHFLAEKEHFKRSTALGNAFYDTVKARAPKTRYLNWQAVAHMDEQAPVEVIVLWTDGAGLSGLVTLANYDRAGNDNVLIPFASGCQSIWTIPYTEQARDEPRAVVGCMDPAVRPYLAADIVSFALPAERFIALAENIAGSFLEKRTAWG